MNYDQIFQAMYTLYRAETPVPNSSDDEYIIGKILANEALNRWANYDATYWKELFDTNQNDGTSGSGGQTITTSDTTYSTPVNFREAGGFIKVKASNGNTLRSIPIIEPQEAQFKNDSTSYSYFTKSPVFYSTGTASQSGTTITGSGTTFTAAMTGMQIQFSTGETATVTYVSTTSLTASVSQTVASTTYRLMSDKYQLNINPAPDSALNGMDIDYIYYKNPTQYTTGTTISEIPNPYFIIHRMLAQRFRVSRNYSAYQTAMRDAEEALKIMQMDNNSGTWANPWSLADNSGTVWGATGANNSFGW